MNRSALVVFLVILAVVFVAVAAAAGFVYWKVNGLKQQLVVSLENTLHAKVEVTSLDLDPWKGEIRAAGISLQNEQPDAPWDSAQIDQAVGYFHVMDVLAPTLPLRIEISGWKANLRTTAATAAIPPPEAGTPAATELTTFSSSSDADRIRVTALSATEGEVSVGVSGAQSIQVHGVNFTGAPSGTEWNTDLQATSITAGTLSAGPSSVHLHSEDQKITFTDLTIHCGDGRISGNGEIGLDGTHQIHGTFNAVSVPISMLVAVRWQVKLSGLVDGDLTYQSDDTSATANGKISVTGGHFNVLPWIGRLTTMVGLPDLTGVELDQATSDVSWKDHILHLQNIDVRKKDMLRVGGMVDVTADGQCDGHLKLGLPTTVIAKWPRLQTEVFTTPLDDYSWTDVHLTGTPDQLQEDLTPRLLTVGAEQSGDLMKQGAQKASDLINSLLK